ncbi:MAG TPA: DUF1015 domain-containing protein [Actinomycetota bacterium]|jgi:uncharacterized protein (DUF1015 family)|nr:DUF1015 domain-containing protein [Actinomycetota bacterium]
MPRVAPFVGLRYDPTVAGPIAQLTAPPYDVISEPHRDGFHAASPYNVAHLDLAAGSLDPEHEESRYARAAELLADWEGSGALKTDREPGYDVYEISWTGGAAGFPGRIRGIFAALALEQWGGAIIPHEETMPGPIEDRLALLRATRTHLSPIYGTVAGPSAQLGDLLDRTCKTDALVDLVDEEDVRHRLWRIAADEPVDEWLEPYDLLIADGHHRYTTALAYRDERHDVDGPGPWDSILSLIVDAGTQHVPVLPYHRVQIAGTTPPLDGSSVDLADVLDSVDDAAGRVGVIERGADNTVLFGVLNLPGAPPVVRTLHQRVLDRAAPGNALRFTHSAADAEHAVRSGEAVAAYVLPPTTPEDVLAAIERGDRLPRKSTFFWPKPRTGLVFMPVRGPRNPPACPLPIVEDPWRRPP